MFWWPNNVYIMKYVGRYILQQLKRRMSSLQRVPFCLLNYYEPRDSSTDYKILYDIIKIVYT